jgi:hypothetical protein
MRSLYQLGLGVDWALQQIGQQALVWSVGYEPRLLVDLVEGPNMAAAIAPMVIDYSTIADVWKESGWLSAVRTGP